MDTEKIVENIVKPIDSNLMISSSSKILEEYRPKLSKIKNPSLWTIFAGIDWRLTTGFIDTVANIRFGPAPDFEEESDA